MSPDYAIFVFPRPWIWAGLAFSLIVLAVNLWLLWRQHRTRRLVAHIAEPLVDICRCNGFTAEAEQIQADIDKLQRSVSWRRPDRKKVAA